MYMLDSARAELHYFLTPEAVLERYGKYAILSHVWDGGEQSFKEVKKIAKRCARTGQNPRDDPQLSDKVRQCCILAEKHGYRWVWIDTCCIDKSSSTELSEAINSMFRYYSLSSVCYAYLRDVPTPEGVSLPNISSLDYRTVNKFRCSVWWSRGWTLQELIAPGLVLFLSESWDIIGSKYDLSTIVTFLSSIPKDVLRHERALSDVCIAQRMSWAAYRKTTRVEDEAYCLLGIFNINMSTLYGEGRMAFRRLQEEIIKTNPDTTIFAWGAAIDGDAFKGQRENSSDIEYNLLASSPSDFKEYSSYEYAPPQELEFMTDDLPRFEFTPYGIRAHIPILDIDGEQFADLCCVTRRGERLLFTLFQNATHDSSQQRRGMYGIKGIRSQRPGYDSSSHRCIAFKFDTERYISHAPTWRDIYFTNEPSSQKPTHHFPMNYSLSTTVRYPSWTELARFADRMHMTVTTITGARGGDRPLVITFRHKRLGQPLELSEIDTETSVALTVGRCHIHSVPNAMHSATTSSTSIWMTLMPVSTSTSYNASHSSHNCTTDHVMRWNNLRRTLPIIYPSRPTPFSHVYAPVFMSESRVVGVSFTPCPFNPSGTLSLNLSQLSLQSWSSFDFYSLTKEYLKNLDTARSESLQHLPDPSHLHALAPMSGFRFRQWHSPLMRTFGVSLLETEDEEQTCFLGTTVSGDIQHPRACICIGNITGMTWLYTKCFTFDTYWTDSRTGHCDVLAYNRGTMEWVLTSHGQVPPAHRPIAAGCTNDGRALYYALGEINGRSTIGVTAEHMGGASCIVFSNDIGNQSGWQTLFTSEKLESDYRILCWKSDLH
ncbi:heterokaryon incompatibility protein-domain-containing protein [Earliella scabrosa]|nr:heterokaryon incompatibility protein-domain-containing protein [Earliella scabrosa]